MKEKKCGGYEKCGCDKPQPDKKDIENGWAETQEQKEKWAKNK